MKILIALVFAACLILPAGCDAPEIPLPTFSFGFQPTFVPIRIGIDSNGNVSASMSGLLVTPVGVFDLTLAQSVPWPLDLDPGRYLIVRVDNDATVFELRDGEQFEVEFDDSVASYRRVGFRQEKNGDIVLELESPSFYATKSGDGRSSREQGHGDTLSFVMEQIAYASVQTAYPDETFRFVASLANHIDDFRSGGITDQTMLQALFRDDVGTRTNALVQEVWNEWVSVADDRGFSAYGTDPGPYGFSPFRQLAIRLIQNRQGNLDRLQQCALYNYYTRNEEQWVWTGYMDGVIGAVNRECFE